METGETFNPVGDPKLDREPLPEPRLRSPAKSTPEEFDRFDDLTRKLIKVSKSELAEKRKGES